MTGFKTGTPTKDGNYKVLVKWHEGCSVDDYAYEILPMEFIDGSWYAFKLGGLTANTTDYDILGWTEEENQWHTGKPTESVNKDGSAIPFLVTDKTGKSFDISRWYSENGGYWAVSWFEVFAWQKIEPYKAYGEEEMSEGREPIHMPLEVWKLGLFYQAEIECPFCHRKYHYYEYYTPISGLQDIKCLGCARRFMVRFDEDPNRTPDFTDCKCCEIREHCKDKEKYDEYLTCEELYELVKKEEEKQCQK